MTTSTTTPMNRNLWKDTEIKALLTIIEEKDILQMLNIKQFRNEQIFRFVESEMHSRGFTKKNFQQIWTKWKFLKSSYVTTKRHNSIPGNNPRTCDYYYLLDRILGNRPLISAVHSGVDLVKCEDDDLEEDDNNVVIEEPEVMEEPEPEPERKPKLEKIQIKTEPHIPVIETISQDVPELVYLTSESNDGPSPSKKRSQGGNYMRAIRDLATNMRQMQKELMHDFFKKQEELMREEHQFQRQQDQLLLNSFEEQTRCLLDSVRNILSPNMPLAPHVVYINEEDRYE